MKNSETDVIKSIIINYKEIKHYDQAIEWCTKTQKAELILHNQLRKTYFLKFRQQNAKHKKAEK